MKLLALLYITLTQNTLKCVLLENFLVFDVVTYDDSDFVVDGLVHLGQDDRLGRPHRHEEEHRQPPQDGWQKDLARGILK